MSRLTRDGTAKPVLQNQIFRRERGQGFFSLLADRVNMIGNLPVNLYSAICDDNNNNNNLTVSCTFWIMKIIYIMVLSVLVSMLK